MRRINKKTILPLCLMAMTVASGRAEAQQQAQGQQGQAQNAQAAAPQPNMMQQLSEQGQNNFKRMGKLLSGMVFGPKSFTKAEQTNPDAEPNAISVSAYTPTLSDSELVEIATAKVHQKWGKRGDIGLYFPTGIQDPKSKMKINFILGEAAERYIKTGGMLRGFATVGMPVDDIGTANWAKNVATTNVAYGIKQAKKSRVIKQALAKIATQQPELKEACRKFDLGNAKLVQALDQRAKRNPRLNKAWQTLMSEVTIPMGFVVNAGFNDNDDGMIHFGMYKRPANEGKRPTYDKVVSKKVADLLFDWFMKVMPNAKTLNPRIFDANHCAGVMDSADWLFMLDRRLKREKPELRKQIMRRIYSYDLGAGAHRPKGVKLLVHMGARDMFGQLNTPTGVMTKAKLSKANHMTNVILGMLNPDDLPALKPMPFAKAFGIRLYDPPASKLTAKQRAQRKSKSLSRLATTYKNMSREQASVLKDLDAASPKEDKSWPTYKLAVANLKGHRAIYKAKQQRAEALSQVASLKASSGTKEQIGAAWAKARTARGRQKRAEAALAKQIRSIGLYRNTLTDTSQYQLYIHGGQATAKQNWLKERYKNDPAGAKRYMARNEIFGKAFSAQLAHLYGRAQLAMKIVRENAAGKQPRPAQGARPARRVPIRGPGR